ncbi:MAG: cytochrome c [Chloroflexi bacterium]|nr:cytochrome c [Chloroflexota bacterium]
MSHSDLTRSTIIYSALAGLIVALAACGGGNAAPTATATPAAPTATPEPTISPVRAAQGKAAFIRIGCVACHAIKGVSDQALAAPALDQAYKLAQDVINSQEYKKSEGTAKTPREFMIESILEPNAFTYPTCPQGPCVKGTMPQNYKDIIRAEEMDPLIDYLLSLGR